MLFDTLHNIILLATFKKVVNLAVFLKIIHSQFGKSASGSHTLHAKICIRQFNKRYTASFEHNDSIAQHSLALLLLVAARFCGQVAQLCCIRPCFGTLGSAQILLRH